MTTENPDRETRRDAEILKREVADFARRRRQSYFGHAAAATLSCSGIWLALEHGGNLTAAVAVFALFFLLNGFVVIPWVFFLPFAWDAQPTQQSLRRQRRKDAARMAMYHSEIEQIRMESGLQKERCRQPPGELPAQALTGHIPGN